MKCLFDENKECAVSDLSIPVVRMGGLCQACVAKATMGKAMESMTVMRAQLILVLLRMFPKEEGKAKEEYQKLMKRVEEW